MPISLLPQFIDSQNTMILLPIAAMTAIYIGIRFIKNNKFLSKNKPTIVPQQKFLADTTHFGSQLQQPEILTSNQQIGISGFTLLSSVLVLLFPYSKGLKITTIILLGLSSFPFFNKAEKALIWQKKINNDVLNALVVGISTVMGSYFTAALITILYHVGTKVLAKTQKKSETMLTDIFVQHHDHWAWSVTEKGEEIRIAVKDIQVGKHIVVNTGEVIVIDGIIAEGTAMLDQHVLTGESMPVSKKVGDKVYASTLLLSGRIYIQVEYTAEHTVAANINKALQNVMHFKTNLQLKGEKAADQAAVPLLVAGGVGMPFIGLSPALAILYSSPGNIFRLCGSLLTLNHLIIASRKGILVKEGLALERMAEVDTIIFDKTGTLTQTKLEVVDVIVHHSDYCAETILAYAASAEYKMQHPIAEAIIDKVQQEQINIPTLQDSEYILGYGVKASILNQIVHVGNLTFLEMQAIPLPENLRQLIDNTYHEHAYSLVMIAIDYQFIGMIAMTAPMRPEVLPLIQQLRHLDIQHIAIISGDHLKPTQELANKIGADTYFSQVLPKEKAEIIKTMQDTGHKVCFVGDGINDAVAMKQADVAVSLTGATAIATDMAQVILMDANLKKLADYLVLAKNLDRMLRQSIMTGSGIALGYVLIFLFYLHVGLLPSLGFSVVLLAGFIKHAMSPLQQIPIEKETDLEDKSGDETISKKGNNKI